MPQPLTFLRIDPRQLRKRSHKSERYRWVTLSTVPTYRLELEAQTGETTPQLCRNCGFTARNDVPGDDPTNLDPRRFGV